MKQMLVMSDSHGHREVLHSMILSVREKYGPMDAYVHCGDGVMDFISIQNSLLTLDQHALFARVKGNCDFGIDCPETAVFELDHIRFFVTHGHRYHVKQSLLSLDYAAAERMCQVALYGHTHIQGSETGSVLMMNPGSVMNQRMLLLQIEKGDISLVRYLTEKDFAE